ncbi:MAG: MlaA family lipoprotein [Rickettsia endosymbiont of Bryobia graminum]|nr:MlaA family lipoprotein [Rickettsia endosymbiont of Bryobia graminum]
MKNFILFIFISIFNFSVIASPNTPPPNPKNLDEEYSYDYNNGRRCSQVYDPYEKFNRKIFAFNSVLDYFIIRPTTIGYKKITNGYMRERVSSFIDNMGTPLTMVNYGLQMNYDQTMKSFWRFLINATFGIGGLFDVASKAGLKVTPQNFGSTLAAYGVGPGPYIVLPFFGGSSARDVTNSAFTSTYFNPIMYTFHRDFKIIFFVMQVIDTRFALLPFTDYVEQNSTDPYIAIRSATHQNRESVVFYPGNFRCPK